MNDGSTKTGGGTGANEFENLHEIVRKGHQNLNQNAWDLLIGGTETGTTLRRNRLVLDSIATGRACYAMSAGWIRRPRNSTVLAPTAFPGSDRSAVLFGAGGGATVAAAAQAFGVPHMLSCTPLETVAEAAPGALRLAQLYVRGDDIERGGVELGMTKQHLDDADISVLLEQVGGEAMPQGVQRDALVDLGQ